MDSAMSYKRILVPVDFSTHSLTALAIATSRFASLENSLTLLHIIDPSVSGETHTSLTSPTNLQVMSPADITSTKSLPSSDVKEARLRHLKMLAAPQVDQWKQIETLVFIGKPTDLIITTANTHQIDLVIMGSFGRGGIGKMLFGSTTYDVARKVTCSVHICRPPAQAAA